MRGVPVVGMRVGYMCRRCGKTVPLREDAGISRLCVYCAECAAIVAERRAQRPSAPAVRIRRVWIDRKRRIYKEYRGTFPAAMFVGLDVEDNYEAAA